MPPTQVSPPPTEYSALIPNVISVKVGSEEIQVKELSWPDCTRMIKDITAPLLAMLNPRDMSLTLDQKKIVEAITANEKTVAWSVAKATGRAEDWVKSLRMREIIPLVSAMVDLHLTEDVIGPGKELAGRIGAVFGWKNGSLTPSTTSSSPAIRSETLKN